MLPENVFSLVGETLDWENPEVYQEIRDKYGRRTRIKHPLGVYTQDYIMDRVNIYVDDKDKVTGITFG